MTHGLLASTVDAVEARLWPATRALEVLYLRQRVADWPQSDVELLKDTVVYLRQQQVLFRWVLDAAPAPSQQGVAYGGCGDMRFRLLPGGYLRTWCKSEWRCGV